VDVLPFWAAQAIRDRYIKAPGRLMVRLPAQPACETTWNGLSLSDGQPVSPFFVHFFPSPD
jgi:hypothetical protein